VSPGKDGPRDWDKELAAIDKVIASGGAAAPAPVPARTGGGAAPAPRAPGAAPPGSLATWLRLGLALLLGAGITQWPYTHGCGLPLFAYLGAIGTVLVASFWSMVSSWRSRSGLAHFLSIGLLFWGTFLGAREVLPRVGYAREQAAWFCGAQPERRSPPAPPTTTTPPGT
jgi:hypothetical protein